MNQTPLYGLRVIATSVLLLALCGVLVIAMFRSTLGPFHFVEGWRSPPKSSVALWAAGDKAERERAHKRWVERLERRFRIDRWSALDLARLENNTVDLVIADGVRIGLEEATALRRFAERGGGLALFGVRGRGTREGAPEAPVLSSLLGRSVRAARSYRWTLLPSAEGPISAGFSSADRLPLRRAHNAYALLGLPETEAEVVWATAEPGGPRQSAAWHTRVGAGRVVWWSVRPDVALDRVDVQASMTRMVRASAAWLLEEPFVEVVVKRSADRESLKTLEARIDRKSSQRYLLSLTNRGEAETPPLVLRVYLNRSVDGVSVGLTAIEIGPGALQIPKIQRLGDATKDSTRLASAAAESVVALHAAAIGGGESRSYYMDLQ